MSSFHYVALLWCSILDQKRPAISHALQLFPSPTTVKPRIFLFLMSYVCGKPKKKEPKTWQREMVKTVFCMKKLSEITKDPRKFFTAMWNTELWDWLTSLTTVQTDQHQGGCLCPWCFCFLEHWWFLFSSLLLFLLFCALHSLLFCFDFGFTGHQGYFPSPYVSS